MSRPLATTITFLISALAHELVMGCITRKFRGYGFIAMMLQMPIVMLQRSKWVRGRTLLNNVLFWCSMILGLSMVSCQLDMYPTSTNKWTDVCVVCPCISQRGFSACVARIRLDWTGLDWTGALSRLAEYPSLLRCPVRLKWHVRLVLDMYKVFHVWYIGPRDSRSESRNFASLSGRVLV